MKCRTCGTELTGEEKVCRSCNSAVEPVSEAAVAAASEAELKAEAAVEPEAGVGGEASTEPQASSGQKKGGKKGLVMGVAAAAAVGAVAAFALTREDPKEVVISAFENIYTEDQVKPAEELFGLSQFMENVGVVDAEDGITLILDSCSDETIQTYGAGSGLRIAAKNDVTNKKVQADIGVIYKDMDLVTMDMYYGDKSIMLSVPELSDKVFALDLGEGLAERIVQSPLAGPMIAESGIDLEGLEAYLADAVAQAESGEVQQLDLNGLYTRFKEGTRAQEKFKAALTVEKAEKGTFTVDGKEISCKGYTVLVSKDSMMEFLRTSRDFFLNDQELKDVYLKQLEQSVKLTEIMGQSSGVSTEEMYQGTVEEVTAAVDQAIDFLDQALSNVNMMVYVTKDGRLAAVKGSTTLKGDVELDEAQRDDVAESAADGMDTAAAEAVLAETEPAAELDAAGEAAEDVAVTFDWKLQGGSYLTQNMALDVELANSEETMAVKLVKAGAYDGSKLTSDVELKLQIDAQEPLDIQIAYDGAYNAEDGGYQLGLSVADQTAKLVDVTMNGVIDKLEKGTSVHMTIDELKAAVMDGSDEVVLSGEYYYMPLAEPVTAPAGESFDVLSADETEWQTVFMEIYMGIMQLAGQLQL